MQNNIKKIYIDQQVDKTIDVGANLAFTENVFSLLSKAESLVGDGEKPRITSWIITIRMILDEAVLDIFTCQPVAVQTAGTFTDTVNLTPGDIDSLLDSSVDDEFGFQTLGDMRVSKFGCNDGNYTRIETRVVLPKNILNLINKEVSTERLQDLLFGLVGFQASDPASALLTIKIVNEIHYSVLRKGITIR
jgi:hypothetical protein